MNTHSSSICNNQNLETTQMITNRPIKNKLLSTGTMFIKRDAAKSFQSCLTVWPPRWQPTRLPGILQARTLEWVAISFSSTWKWKVKVKLLSHVRLLATSWTADCQAPPSMGFSRQQYWSGVPLPSPIKWDSVQ